jgi:hypothetical protein
MNRDERVAAFDIMTGQPGQRLGSLQYLDTQMSGRGGAPGPSGGGGAGDYVVGQGWSGQ